MIMIYRQAIFSRRFFADDANATLLRKKEIIGSKVQFVVMLKVITCINLSCFVARFTAPRREAPASHIFN